MQMLPRPLVDESESEVWSINQIQFSLVLATQTA